MNENLTDGGAMPNSKGHCDNPLEKRRRGPEAPSC